MRALFSFAATIALTTTFSHADLQIDVNASAGEGDHTAYAVIDFSATNYGVYAFSYSWNGDATVHDMLLALEDEVSLMYAWTDWGSGIFVDNFAWGSPAGNPDYYWAHSLGTIFGDGPDWSDAYLGVEQTVIADGAISGWYNGFNDDYSAIPPALPLIPGPGGLALLAAIAAGPRRRR